MDMKFHTAPNGEIDFRHTTYLDALLPLGALRHACQYKPDVAGTDLPTDWEGLKTTENLVGSARAGITDMIEAFAFLSVYADRTEIPDSVWLTVAWAQVGLMHLLREVDYVADVAENQRRRIEKAAATVHSGG